MLIAYMYSVDSPSLRVNQVYLKEQKVKTMLKYGFLLSFATLSSLGIKYLDSIMIAKYMPIEYAGIYGIVVFIPAVIEAPLNSLDRIAYAKVGQALAMNNHVDVREIYYKSSRYLFALGGALFLGVNVNIADLLSFLPAGYSKGINVVLIISLGTLINMAGGTNTSIIFNSRFYRIGGYLLIFLALMAFGLNILLIPKFGLEGSAMATAITVVTFAVSRYIIIYKGFHLQPYDRNMLRITALIVAGMILHYVLPHVHSPVVNILYRSTVITGFYAAGIYYFNIVPELNNTISRFLKRA
jgi:O-antigen/teichoic acid export membrane protein